MHGSSNAVISFQYLENLSKTLSFVSTFDAPHPTRKTQICIYEQNYGRVCIYKSVREDWIGGEEGEKREREGATKKRRRIFFSKVLTIELSSPSSSSALHLNRKRKSKKKTNVVLLVLCPCPFTT